MLGGQHLLEPLAAALLGLAMLYKAAAVGGLCWGIADFVHDVGSVQCRPLLQADLRGTAKSRLMLHGCLT